VQHLACQARNQLTGLNIMLSDQVLEIVGRWLESFFINGGMCEKSAINISLTVYKIPELHVACATKDDIDIFFQASSS
jgi:hypothetical protein